MFYACYYTMCVYHSTAACCVYSRGQPVMLLHSSLVAAVSPPSCRPSLCRHSAAWLHLTYAATGLMTASMGRTRQKGEVSCSHLRHLVPPGHGPHQLGLLPWPLSAGLSWPTGLYRPGPGVIWAGARIVKSVRALFSRSLLAPKS